MDLNLRPYNFQPPKQLNDENFENCRVTCPPYHVLVDHTLGVVWNCFSNKRKDIGKMRSSQVIWALKFIESAVDNKTKIGSEMRLLIDYLTDISLDMIAQEKPEPTKRVSYQEDDSLKNLSISLAEVVKGKEYQPITDEKDNNIGADDSGYHKFASIPSAHSSHTSLRMTDSKRDVMLRDLIFVKDTIEDWRKHQKAKIDLEAKHLQSIDTAISYLSKRKIPHVEREES